MHRIKSNLLNNQFLPNIVPTKYDKSTKNKSILYKQFYLCMNIHERKHNPPLNGSPTELAFLLR